MANYTSQYTFGVSADTKSAQSSLNALTKSLREIASKKYTMQVDDASITRASNAAFTLQQQLIAATNVNTGKIDFTKLNQGLQQAGTSVSKLGQDLLAAGAQGQKAFGQLASTIASAEAPVKRLSSAFTTMGTTLMNTIKWQASSSLIHGLMSSVSGAISYVKNLNGTLNDIRVVTGQSSDEMARFAEYANRAAKELSTSTNEFAKASLIYYQQGDSAELAAKKAALTVKAANVAFTASAQEMSEMLTAVWNSYQAGEDQLEHMVDVLAKLGATTASSMEEMATGMQKVAATANTVGVSMEQMSAIVATSASVTRQAPQTIGTAWNTILSRIGGLKLGETLEDGTDLNKYSKALQTIGVDILDASGNLREMGGVVDEIGAKWDNLNQAQKSALAQTIGGARQYTQILAFFENFDKYQANMRTAQNSDGALQEQADIYAESWEAASKRVQAAMETLYSQLIDDKAITKLTSLFATIINGFTSLTQSFGGAGNVISLLVTQIAQSHLDVVATKIAEIGTNIKTLFSGNTEINQYAQELGQMQQQLQSTIDTDGVSNSLKIELGYDQQILAIKQQMAEKQGQLTVAQKEGLATIIKQVEAQKEYYTNLQASAEAAQKAANTSKADAASELVRRKAQEMYAADTGIVGANLNMESAEIQKQWLRGASKLDYIDADKDVIAQAKTLNEIMDELQIKADKITVQTLVDTLSTAATKAGELSTEAVNFTNAFTNPATGSISFENYLGTDAEGLQYLKDQITSIFTDMSVAPDWAKDLLKINEVDASNLNTVNTAVKNLSESMNANREAANGTVEGLRKYMTDLGFSRDIIDDVIAKHRELGTTTAHTGDQMEKDIAKNMQNIKAQVDKTLNSASTKVKTFVSTAMTLQRVATAFTAVSNAVKTIRDPDVDGWTKFTTVVSTLVTVGMAAQSVASLMNTTLIKNSIAQAAATASSVATTAAKSAETVAWYSSAAGVKAFTKALLANPITAVLVGITALIVGLVSLISYLGSIETTAQKAAKADEQLTKELEKQSVKTHKLTDDIASLHDIMNDTTLSYTEQIERINQITEAYGIQANAVDILSGRYTNLIKQMSAATVAEASQSADNARDLANRAEANTQSMLDEYYDTTAYGGGHTVFTSQSYNEELSSLFTDSAWTEYKSGHKRDNNTLGIIGRGREYYGQHLSDEGKLFISDKDMAARFAALGFKWDEDEGQLVEDWEKEQDYTGLYQLLTSDTFAPYANKSGSYTSTLLSQLKDIHVDTAARAEQAANDAELIERIVTKVQGHLFDTEEQNISSVEAVIDEILGDDATKENRALVLSELQKLPAYQNAAAQLSSVDALAESFIIQNPDLEINEEQVRKDLIQQITDSNGEISADILLRINPTDVEIDEKTGKAKIKDKAAKLAQAQVDLATAQQRAASIQELEETATAKVLSGEDYQTLKDSGLMEDTELDQFMRMTQNQRKERWQELAALATQQQHDSYETIRSLAEEKIEELSGEEGTLTTWVNTFLDANKEALAGYQTIIENANTPDEAFALLRNKLLTSIQDRDNLAQQIQDYESAQASDDWTTYDEKYQNHAESLESLRERQEQARQDAETLNGVLERGIQLDSALADAEDDRRYAVEGLESLKYDEKANEITRATNAITAFNDAVGQQGSMTGEALNSLAKYSGVGIEEIIAKYQTLSEVEWAKYMYDNAVKYYDQLYALYEGDAAAQVELLQQKKKAEQDYKDLVTENAQEIAETQKAKWDEVRSAVTSVNSAIKDLTTGTKEFGDLSFEEIENLRNNLMTVYNDAEKVDALLKNLGKEDLSGKDKESILAAAKLKTEMLLESAAATEAERSQLYGGLASEMQSRIDSTRQININGEETLGGTYELTVTAPGAWNPDTGELTVYNPESGVEYTVRLAQAPQCAGYDPTTGIITLTDGGGTSYRVNLEQGLTATGYDPKTGIVTLTNGADINYKVNIGAGAKAVGYNETTGVVTLRAGNGVEYPVNLEPGARGVGYDPTTGILTIESAGTTYEVNIGAAAGITGYDPTTGILTITNGENVSYTVDLEKGTAAGYDPATGIVTLTMANGTTYKLNLTSDATSTAIFDPKTGIYTVQDASGQLILTAQMKEDSGLKFDPTTGTLVSATGEQIVLSSDLKVTGINYNEDTNQFTFFDAKGQVVYEVAGVEGLTKEDAGNWTFTQPAQGEVNYIMAEGSDSPPETGTVTVTDEVTYTIVSGVEPPENGESREIEVKVNYKENTIGNIIATRNELSAAYNASGRKAFEDRAKAEQRGLHFSDMTNAIVNQYGGDLRAYQVGTGKKTEDISKNIASIGKEVTRQWQKFVDDAGGDIAKAWEAASQDEAFMGGYNLFAGLVRGYKVAFGDYGNVFTDTSTDLLLQIMTSLGEHSPSVYTQEMGRYLMEGLSIGFESTEFTGAEGLQERVLNKIKSELTNIPDEFANEYAYMASKLGKTYETTEEGQMAQTGAKKLTDGTFELNDKIYTTMAEAYQAYLTEQFSAKRLQEYLSGGYRDDLTALQQYALDKAMQDALKKYNAQNKTNLSLDDVLKVDAGNFATLVQTELNTANNKLIAGTKTTIAQLKDLWSGTLTSIYDLEQATIQKTVDSWTNAWSAIIKARKTIWEENTSLFAALGEAEMKEVIAGWRKAGYSPEQIRAMALATDGSGARAVTADPYVNSGLQQLGDAAYLNYDSSGRYISTSYDEWYTNKANALRNSADTAQVQRDFNKSIYGDEYINTKAIAAVAGAKDMDDAAAILSGFGIFGPTNVDKYLAAATRGRETGALQFNKQTGEWSALAFTEVLDKWIEDQMGKRGSESSREQYDAAEDTAMYNDINYASQSRSSTIEQGSGYLAKQQKDLDILNTVAEGLAEGKTLAEIFEGNDEDLQRFQELMGESTITLESVSDKSMELATAMGDCATAVQIAAEMIRTGMADSAIINDDGTVTTSKTTKDINGNDVTVNYTLGANGKVINATQTSTDLHTFSANDLEQRDYWAQQGYTVANQDNDTLVASKIVTESLDTNNIDLPEGVETGDSTVDSDVKLTRAQQDEINANYATNAGFGSVQELKEYAQRLQEIGKITKEINEDEAMKFASGLARQEKGFANAQKNMSTYQKTLSTLKKTYKDTYKESTEYTKTLEDIRDTYGDVFNLTADQANSLSDTFLTSAENAELLEKAIKQDDAAWDQLKANAAKDIVAQVTVDGSKVQTECNNILNTIAAYDFEANGIKVGASIETAPFYEDLNNMVFYSQETADAMSAALSTVGVEGTWEPVTVSVPANKWEQVVTTGSYDYIDNNGVLHSVPVDSFVEGEEGAHTATMWLFQGAKSKYKGGSSPAPASSSSSGGGGGGGSKSAKKVEGPKRGSDEKERYHEITKKLGEQASILTRLEKIKSRTFGANHLKAINDEIAALEKENELYAQQAAEASANMDANRARLEQYGATFNEDGTLNYDEYMDKIIEQYNAAVEKYNSSSQTAADELALKEAEEIYNEAKKAMEDYEEDMDKLNEAQENMLENQNKISAAMLEGIQYKVELKFDFNDRDIKMMQYFRDKWEELYDMQDESMRYMAEEAIKYEDNLNTLGNAMDKLNAEYANGTLNEADYAAGLQDVNDKIVEQLNNLLTIKQAIKDAYGNTLQQATEELSKHTAVLEHSHSVMEQYIQLQQLMGLGADYSGLSKMYEVQYKSSVMNVKAARDYLDTLKNSKKEIEANIAIYGETDVLKQQLEDVNTAIQEGEDDLLSKTNQALTDAQNMFSNTMQAIVQTFDEQLFKMKNGLANLEDDYAYYQEEQARYLSTSKELYEVSKLNRQINDSIADATTKTSKERLKALQEYINAQADSTRLTEYDVQMMELQYKHALALQELEDARNAKSVVRLTRDENGNFGYQYTADDQNISDAQQKVEDALQQINELAANRVAEIEQAAIQAEREYRDSLLTIAADTTLTLEERQAKMEELTERYAKTMQFNQEQYNNASNALLTNQQYVYERYGVSIMSNTQMTQDQMKTSVGEMINQTTDYATFLQKQMSPGGAIYEALQTYKDNITTVGGVSGLHSWENMVASAADFEEANEAAADALSTINDTLATTLTNIADVTGEWEDHAAALDTVIANYEKLGQTAVDTLRKLAGNLDETEPTATSGAATDEEIESTEKQWMYSWGYGGYSGSWSGYDSRKAAIAGAKSDIYQKIMSTLEAGETDEETASNRSKLQAKIDAALKTIQVTKYKTGGLIDYTGPAWVDGSLSNPELMLNSDDTRNMLRTIQLVRDLDIETLTSLYEAINQTALGMMYSLSGIAAPSGSGTRDVLEQNVQITAEFPNATDRNEITAAFEDLVNLAAQYANRR